MTTTSTDLPFPTTGTAGVPTSEEALTGKDSDATDGVQAIKQEGGVEIAQDRSTSEHFDMPRSAIRTGAVVYVLPLDRIGPALTALVHGRPIETLPSRS